MTSNIVELIKQTLARNEVENCPCTAEIRISSNFVNTTLLEVDTLISQRIIKTAKEIFYD